MTVAPAAACRFSLPPPVNISGGRVRRRVAARRGRSSPLSYPSCAQKGADMVPITRAPSSPHRLLALPAVLAITVAIVGCGDQARHMEKASRQAATVTFRERGADKDKDKDKDKDTGSHNTESYARITENAFARADRTPLSTFSIDVDTASYSNVRRFLMQERRLPPVDAVRVEELVNYFPYSYLPPKADHPVAFTLELGECPWNGKHHL